MEKGPTPDRPSHAILTVVIVAVLVPLFLFVYPPSLEEHTAMEPNLSVLDASLFGTLITGLFVFLFLDFGKLDFELLRGIYTGLSVSLLIYRTILYWLHNWILFMVDLCPVAQFCLLFTLWTPALLEDAEWFRAIFTIMNGPIAGSTFLLSTMISVDNVEVFMSFFLHVAPQWLAFPLRWRTHAEKAAGKPQVSTCGLWWNGMTRIYVKWYLFMGIFLTLQPFLPGVNNMMTLYDWMAGSILGYELMPRDWPFWKWTLAAWIYVTVHAIMASYGAIMASLAFQYKPAHIAYTACVLLGLAARSASHYFFGGSQHDITVGLCEALVSGIIVSGIALYCSKQEKAGIVEGAILEDRLLP